MTNQFVDEDLDSTIKDLDKHLFEIETILFKLEILNIKSDSILNTVFDSIKNFSYKINVISDNTEIDDNNIEENYF